MRFFMSPPALRGLLAFWNSRHQTKLEGREATGGRSWLPCTRPSHVFAGEFEGSSAALRLFFFERCQTTPGKPFSGTSRSPV